MRHFERKASCWRYFVTRENGEGDNKELRDYCTLLCPDQTPCSYNCAHTGSTTTSKNRHIRENHKEISLPMKENREQTGIEKEFAELVVKMIISGALPYQFAENFFFKKLIEKYTSQTPLTYYEVKRVEDVLYNEKVKAMREIISSLITVSMTTDGWKCVPLKKSFISLTLHYLNSMWNHQSLDLGIYLIEGSHSASNIVNKLEQIFSLFELEKSKISSITADNASNMKKLARLLGKNYIGCFAHLINLIVNKAFAMCFLRKKNKNPTTKTK